ncbi:hypothetical protein [Paraburkholderia sp. BR14374]|uniref:hypothetical protein n=1 Tax=Paraburkholderia sp. BR14374 TaxID=3237007 RepID=UPI0034CF4412
MQQISQILQDILNLTRYATSPFVLNGRPDSVRQWLLALQEHLNAVRLRVDNALASLDESKVGELGDWTDEERILSNEWVLRHYPNESENIRTALRKAWCDGQRLPYKSQMASPATNQKFTDGFLVQSIEDLGAIQRDDSGSVALFIDNRFERLLCKCLFHESVDSTRIVQLVDNFTTTAIAGHSLSTH